MPNRPPRATPVRPIAEACAIPSAPLVERIRGQGERVHIPLGLVCNNNCLFCMEDDREARKRINAAMQGDRVRWVLEQHVGADEVCFTSGEPTLNAQLALFIREARDLGYARVSLMTNGRRFVYPEFVAQLLRAGLNRVYVSIHGHHASLHDGLTRTPGSFVQTLAGLRAVSAMRERGISLHTSTVLTTRNASVQLEIYEMLMEVGVDQAVFNALQVTGRAAHFVARVVPRYQEVRAGFQRLLDRAPDHGDRAFLVDVPMCVTHGLPDRNRGWMERHVHYEAEAGDPETWADGGSADLRRVHTADLDSAFRSYGPGCARCVYRPECPGVYANYVRHHGWSEFQPVSATR